MENRIIELFKKEKKKKIQLSKDKKTGLYYRPWTTDLEIIRGVYIEYNITDFKNTDIVFDLGANIGAFCNKVSKLVKKVYAFEPDPINFKIAKLNNHLNKNVILFNSAIIGNYDKKRYLYKSYTCSEASHSLHRTSRNEKILVSCVNYKKMINKYKPTIIKSDIEGEEYYLFNEILFNTIRIFIAEFHLSKKIFKESFDKILNSLLNIQGFKSNKEIKLTRNPRHIVINLWRNK